jgi:hypothetical protein
VNHTYQKWKFYAFLSFISRNGFQNFVQSGHVGDLNPSLHSMFMQQDHVIFFQGVQIICAKWQQTPDKAFSNALPQLLWPAATYNRQMTREIRRKIC